MSILDKIFLRKKNSLAFYDTATGAKNKAYLDRVVHKRYQHTDTYFSVLDIIEFKKLNDLQGHLAGDLALKTLASLIMTQPDVDEVCHFGGDKFIVVHRASLNLGALSQIFERTVGHAFCWGTYHKLAEESCLTALDKADKRLHDNKRLSVDTKSNQQIKHDILTYLDQRLSDYTDLRLGQLIYEAICQDHDDLYYVSDKIFAQRLKNFTKEEASKDND